MTTAAKAELPHHLDPRTTQDVGVLLGPERLAMQAEVAALALAPGTYYRDRDGQLHEVEFQRTPSVFLEGKSAGINLTIESRYVNGRYQRFDVSDRVTRLRRPEVDVVATLQGAFAARGKYTSVYIDTDRDYTYKALVWDDNILDYRSSEVDKSKYTAEELADPADVYARSTRLTHLTVRTPHTTFEGRHSLPRILALLAVLQEARGMGLRLSDKPFEMQYLPHQYADVAIELPAGGHVPLDDRPEGVVGRASFHLGGARAPKRYFVL